MVHFTKTSVSEGPIRATLDEHWKLFVLQGAGLTVLGVAAVVLPNVASLAIDLLIGWLLLITGLFRFASIFSAQGAPGYWSSLLLAVLTAVLGALLALWPVAGILTLTMAFSAYLIAHGMANAVIAGAVRRQTDRWPWIVAGAAIDFLLAGLIIAGWPSTAGWVLGLYFGINLAFTGVALMLAAVGYVASFLVFGTFCMKDIVHLRLTAILSNIAFAAYGLALNAPPIWGLHLALLPTNIWRLYGVTQSRVAPSASERNAAASIGN